MPLPSKWWAFPILFFQFLNTGLVGPSLPDIIVPFFGGDFSRSALAQGIVDSIGAFIAFIVSPIIGYFSDHYGRKYFISLLVFLTSLQIFCLWAYPTISLWFYLCAKAMGKISVFGSVLSYIADCTTLQDRTQAFGQAMASIFAALTCGPALAIMTTPSQSFTIACVGACCNVFYCFFILPESLTEERRRIALPRIIAHERAQRAKVYGSLQSQDDPEVSKITISSTPAALKNAPPKKKLNPIKSLQYLSQNKLFLVLTCLVFFNQLCEYGVFETEPIYLRDVLHFSRDDRSHLMFVTGVSTFLVMTFVMPRLMETMKERTIILIALCCNFLHITLYACVWTKFQVLCIAVIGSGGFMCYPAASSFLSKRVPALEQGRAQGSLSGYKSLTQGLGPLLFSLVFSFFTSGATPFFLPQMPFFLGSVFILAAIIFSLYLPDPSLGAKAPSPIKHKPHSPPTHSHTHAHSQITKLLTPEHKPSRKPYRSLSMESITEDAEEASHEDSPLLQKV